MGHPLSQGLLLPLGTEESQLHQLLLPQGQVVALLQKEASAVTETVPQARQKSWLENSERLSCSVEVEEHGRK